MSIFNYTTSTGKKKYKAQIWQKGKRVASRTFERKIDAQEWNDRERHKLVDKQVGRFKGHNVSLEDFFENVYWPNKKIREGTAADYRRIFDKHFLPNFGKLNLTEIDEEMWSSLFTSLVNSGMSKGRSNRVHSVASAVMNLAYKWKYIPSNPLELVQWFKEEIRSFDFWSFEEVEQFLNWNFQNKCPRYSLYHAAYELGLRMEEIVGLPTDCIDLAGNLVHVRQSFCKVSKKVVHLTKSGHERIVGFSEGLKSSLIQTLNKGNSEFVFTNQTGNPITHDYLRYHFDKDQELAGVRRIHFHALRHTFASHFMMRGGNIYDLKALLGHASIETTMRYAHLSPGHLKEQSKLVSFTPAAFGKVLPLSTKESHAPNSLSIEVKSVRI